MGQPGIFGTFSEPTSGFVAEDGQTGDMAPSPVLNPNIYLVNIDISGLTGDTFTLTGDFDVFSGEGFNVLDETQLTFSSLFDPVPVIGENVELTDNGDGTFEATYDLPFLRSAIDSSSEGTFQDVITITDTGDQTDDADDLAFITFSCFCTGTAITTEHGAVAVENLNVGDLVLTSDGQSAPVIWLGKQTVSTRFGPAERFMPVRIVAGALGGGLPVRDLHLTSDHALMIDGFLVNAGALVNGTTIHWVPLNDFGDSFSVFHVETEKHSIIFAEGAAAETFIDYSTRHAFDNYQEYLDLHATDRIIAEMDMPRISTSRLLPEPIKKRLNAFASSRALPC